jgi:hypothetical protein
MKVFCDKKYICDIEDSVLVELLSIYPEENLLKRKIFSSAILDGDISIEELIKESEKIQIPWQFFFLNSKKLMSEITHIEEERKDRCPSKVFLAKRNGFGDHTSKRIIDRIIRLQDFVIKSGGFLINPYVSSIKTRDVSTIADYVNSYFDFEWEKYREKHKNPETTLTHLIAKITSNQINICQGTLANHMLPSHSGVTDGLYKNTSGFAALSDKLPFIFLPKDINPDEIQSRQIYTLLYLLVGIGVGDVQCLYENKLAYKIKRQSGIEWMIHCVVSEILLPKSVTDALKSENITKELVAQFSLKYKLSRLAVVTILLIRKKINQKTFDMIKPDKFIPGKRPGGPINIPISSSVRAFCGEIASLVVNSQIKNGGIKSMQAQYLIFGRPRKSTYKEYLNQI